MTTYVEYVESISPGYVAIGVAMLESLFTSDGFDGAAQFTIPLS
ncbi:hypothetical protein SAMN05216285_3394 [Natrinema salifodinae]|uniref:Uncharacterized protein n=1 Tax=Natrinema salifodinae TaxID=1202768 RepID=A0A1I0QCS7_9EURY|nr:hypothetical protein SAMN05216285_3394 [Natrinema salifodinae]